MTTAVEFRDVSKSYGSKPVVTNLNLTIEDNRFSVIYGAPACGKSTILRLLTGLEKPDSGHVFLRGRDVSGMAPGERNIGYVPQSFALYPHYKVFDNIGYPLKLMGMPKAQIKPIVERTAELLKITHLLTKKPEQLSGGEKQRVAIARGIVKNTNIFVLDDPLTGLDFKLREQLFDDLRQMRTDLNATFVYTTSDPLETLILAEDVHILDNCQIIEEGPLDEVYGSPAHVRTMALLGFPEANVFSGQLARDGAEARISTRIFEFDARLDSVIDVPEAIRVALRPQDLLVNPPADAGLLTESGVIHLVEDLGGEQVVYLEVNETHLVAVVRHDWGDLVEGPATIGVNPDRLFLYAEETGRRIGRGKQ